MRNTSLFESRYALNVDAKANLVGERNDAEASWGLDVVPGPRAITGGDQRLVGLLRWLLINLLISLLINQVRFGKVAPKSGKVAPKSGKVALKLTDNTLIS